MTATNHALTGALIATVVPYPPLALLLALLSHFVLDALPHFGNYSKFNELKSNAFRNFLIADMFGAFIVGASILLLHPPGWFYICLAAVLGTSPDLMWFPSFLRVRRGKPRHSGTNWLLRFHTIIQWAERPWGIWIEICWALICAALLASYLQ